MISLQKGLEDYNELSLTIKVVNNLNALVELISENNTYEITNDLREHRNLIDINYKSICATIVQKDDHLIVDNTIEVWDEDGSLAMTTINIYAYSQYEYKILDDGRLYVNSGSHPYDDQDYYYAYDNRICKSGKLVEEVKYDKNKLMNETDQIIERLMYLNGTLKSKMCYN